MKAIQKKPGEQPTEVELKKGIDHLQELVGGGCFTTVYHPALEQRGITLWANDEGLFLDMEPNLIVMGQPIVGPVVFTGHNSEGETVALDESQAIVVGIFLARTEITNPIRREAIRERIRAML